MGKSLTSKILLNLFVTPGTVIFGAGGVGLLFLSEMLGPMAAFLGFCGMLACMGLMLTNYLFHYGRTRDNVLRKMREDAKAERNSVLDALDRKLCRDRDPRDQEALRNLRTLYDTFMDDLETGKLAYAVPRNMLDQIDQLFNAAVGQLQRQYSVWETSTKVTGSARKALQEEREQIIVEIEAAVTNLAQVIEGIRTLKMKADKGELQAVRDRLNQQLEVTLAVDRRLSEMNQNPDDMGRFKEYEGQ